MCISHVAATYTLAKIPNSDTCSLEIMYLYDSMLGVINERFERASEPCDLDKIANWTRGSGLQE
jgi:hypothetical protein